MFWLTHSTTELHNVSTPSLRVFKILDSFLPEANQSIANDVLNAHAQRRHPDIRNDKLQYEDSYTSSHATRKGRKSQEQHHASLPCDARSAVAEGVGAKTLLLDRVDDEHTQAGEDQGKPVDEFDVDVGAVHG